MRTGSDWASAIRKCTIDYHWQGWWRTQTQAKAYKMFANTTEWKNDNMTRRTLQCCLVLFLRLLVALLVFHWNLSLVHFGLYQQEGRHRCGCLCGPVFFVSFLYTNLFVCLEQKQVCAVRKRGGDKHLVDDRNDKHCTTGWSRRLWRWKEILHFAH